MKRKKIKGKEEEKNRKGKRKEIWKKRVKNNYNAIKNAKKTSGFCLSRVKCIMGALFGSCFMLTGAVLYVI